MTTPTPDPRPTPTDTPIESTTTIPTPSLTPSPVDAMADPTAAQVLDFISSLVSSLAWPALVLTLVLMFRHVIRGILVGLVERIKHLRELDVLGTKMRFAEDVADLSEKVEDVEAAAPPEVVTSSELDGAGASSSLLALARTHPAMAVVKAFITVEEAGREYLIERYGNPPKGSVIYALGRDKYLPEVFRAFLRDLASVRNQAAHSSDAAISVEDAERYIEVAQTGSNILRRTAEAVRENPEFGK